MAAPVRAALMITCLGDMFFPEVGVAMVRLLRGLGVEVEFPEGQTCCGMPLFNSGYHHDAALVAARTVKLFERAEHVVVPSGSCAWMVKTESPGLLKHDPALRAAAESLARRTRELSQFLVEVLGVSRVDSPFEGRVTYHDSCHLLRGIGVKEQPRRLLRRVSGLELVEMKDSDYCCGFGGAFAIKYPDISGAMVYDKVDKIVASGVDTVVGCDTGCLLNIAGAVSRRGLPIKTMHIAEILAHRK